MLSNRLSGTEMTSPATARSGSRGFLVRKIWLPRALYGILPYFYIGAGIAAFLGTLYINQWFWVLPHYVLFSAACIHLGIAIFGKRRQRPEDGRQ